MYQSFATRHILFVKSSKLERCPNGQRFLLVSFGSRRTSQKAGIRRLRRVDRAKFRNCTSRTNMRPPRSSAFQARFAFPLIQRAIIVNFPPFFDNKRPDDVCRTTSNFIAEHRPRTFHCGTDRPDGLMCEVSKCPNLQLRRGDERLPRRDCATVFRSRQRTIGAVIAACRILSVLTSHPNAVWASSRALSGAEIRPEHGRRQFPYRKAVD